MKQEMKKDPLESFSLAEARRLVTDLFEPNPWIYWTDFMVTISVGMACFPVISHAPSIPVRLVAFVVCALAFYRASIFTHEMVHLPGKKWKPFRFAWNMLCGIPFLIPSFTYYTHLDHHRRKHYGTRRDAEYLPLAAQPPYKTVLYLMQSLVAYPLAIIRFGIVTPLSWISPAVRDFAAKHASSMIMDPFYIRPLPSAKERRVWRIQELLCFAWVVGLATVYIRGVIPFTGKPLPWDFLPKLYGLSVAIMLLNSIRTLGSHRFLGADEEEFTFTEQLVDSVNHPGHAIVGPLWAPLGQRYHALHHLFPSMPYHHLGTAHYRLMEQLPADSAYRMTNSPGLTATLVDLWRQARSSARGVAPVPPWHVQKYQEPNGVDASSRRETAEVEVYSESR